LRTSVLTTFRADEESRSRGVLFSISGVWTEAARAGTRRRSEHTRHAR
jgi:hypothetical protein